MSTKGNPVCVITGGSRGIGLATAKRFSSEGYSIVITGRNRESLDSAVEEIESTGKGSVIALAGDIGDPASRKQIIDTATDKFGSIDVLVNNAGAAPLGQFDSIEESTFESTLQTNVRAVFYLTQETWKLMKQNSGGTIVNVSSMAAVDPFPGFSIYGAAKAWLELFTKALAAEGADHNIRVCAVRPGAVETDLLRGLFPDFPAEDCVQPSDIADCIFGCVKDPEKYPSGEAFTVAK